MDVQSTQPLICTIHNSVSNGHLSVPCAQKSASRLKFMGPITGGKIPNISFGGSVTRSQDRLNSYIDVEFFLEFVTQMTDACPSNVSVVQVTRLTVLISCTQQSDTWIWSADTVVYWKCPV